jgi:gliding motility-associated-like protein
MNNWYFGLNCGITFNTNPPSFLPNGQIATKEGCSVMSDTSGNLLFYSDGEKIWNRNHVVMPNGSGLKGDFSSAQSALIVRMPGSFTIYYVFTAPEILTTNGLQYSIVDMSLDGGLGDVTSVKNVVLLASSIEELTGVVHANGSDIWIIGHEWQSGDFYVWLLTSTGINGPVISTSGPIFQSYPGVSGSEGNGIGLMKVSPCGDKIAYVVGFDEYVEMQDFDNATGILSHPIYMGAWPGLYPFGVFAVEFSPGCSKLYIMIINDGRVVQYDLNAVSVTAMLNSADTVITDPLTTDYFGSIQNGPDGKMYLIKLGYNWLGCINNPDESGVAINYIDHAVYCGGQGRYGLPNNITSLYRKLLIPESKFVIDSVRSCDQVCFSFTDSTKNNPTSWHWYFSGADIDSSNIKNPDGVCFHSSGTFPVKLIACNGAGCDSTETILNISIAPPPLIYAGNDTAICNGNSVQLHATTGFANYEWQFNLSQLPDNSPDITATSPGEYIVSGEDASGCVSIDTIRIMNDTQPNAFFNFEEHSDCFTSRILFINQSTNATTYQWNFGDGNESFEASPVHIYGSEFNGTITLIAKNGFCPDTFSISGLELKSFVINDSIPNIITPNGDGLNDCFHLKDDGGVQNCYTMKIFNRWGEIVFDSSEHIYCWNGQINNTGAEVPAGIYYYLLIADIKKLKGLIQVIR